MDEKKLIAPKNSHSKPKEANISLNPTIKEQNTNGTEKLYKHKKDIYDTIRHENPHLN